MSLKAKIIFLFIFSQFILSHTCDAEGCKIEIIVQHEKQKYEINDTIIILVKVHLDQAFCNEAGEATKIFSKGLKIVERSEWKKISNTILGQKLILTVIRASDEKTLTVFRKTAHYDCFEQKSFKMSSD